MLKSLSVDNFAVIEKINFELSPSLNVFTGETGAGKSIALGALGFVLGWRASADNIKSGANKTAVQAVFDMDDVPQELRKKYTLTGGDLVLRREMDINGRGKCFINSRPYPVSALADIGESLADFHSQHEHQKLLKQSEHIKFLDNFAGLGGKAEKFKQVWDKRKAVAGKLSAVKLTGDEKERLLDLYKFQLQEIESCAPKPNEDAELEDILPKLKNSGKILEFCAKLRDILSDGENSVSEKTGISAKFARELADTDPAFEPCAGNLDNALSLIGQSYSFISDYQEKMGADYGSIDDAIGRMDKISRLKKKYGETIPAVLQFAEALKIKIDDLQSADFRTKELEEELAGLDAELEKQARALNKERTQWGKKLSAVVIDEIKPLGFGDIKFSVSVEFEVENMSSSGADNVEFLFSANPDEPLRPLKGIASGGEMSRVMLGLKTAFAKIDDTPVLVFDEVDAGIGGVTAALVGKKLEKISARRQILCVTHLAQVAGFGAKHFAVEKKTANGKTAVSLRSVEGEQRVAEIARMLGGKTKSSVAADHARELLKQTN